jgi:hypothetical protein
MVQWFALVSDVMNLRLSKMRGIFAYYIDCQLFLRVGLCIMRNESRTLISSSCVVPGVRFN